MKRSPYDIVAIFEQMALDLIASMRRNLARHRLEETKEGFRWEMWQRAKLRALGGYRRTNSKIIRKAIRESEKLTDDVLKQSFREGERRHEPLWRRFLNRILRPFISKRQVEGMIQFPKGEQRLLMTAWEKLPSPTQERQFFSMNERKLEALQETVKADLRKAEHGVLRKMDDVYRQVIYKAELNMAAGAKTLNQAIDMATREFLSKGINVIEYKDGRKMNISSYAEMALRTASQRATFLGEGKKRDEWGIYTVVMSAHENCSPWCLPYQGTVMIDDVYTSISPEQAQELSRETGYKLLSEAMKNGAFHPNCKHSLSTYFPGITKLPEPANNQKALRIYEAEQHQRYIERQIRRYKRLVAGTLDEGNQKRYVRKLDEWEERMAEHLNRFPQLRRSRSREVDRTA